MVQAAYCHKCILVMPRGLICNKVYFHVKEHLPVSSVLEMRYHVLWSVVATVQEESIASVLSVDGCVLNVIQGR